MGLVGIITFSLYEVFVTERLTMPLRLFANRTPAMGLFMSFLNGMAITWTSYFLPLYFQALNNPNPIMAGMYALPAVLAIVPSGEIGGWTITITGRYRPVLLIGWCFTIVGAGLFTMLTANTTTGTWIVYEIIAGVGVGTIWSTTFAPVQASLDEADVALSTSTLTFCRSFGMIWAPQHQLPFSIPALMIWFLRSATQLLSPRSLKVVYTRILPESSLSD
jgi:MFS family permease